MKVAILHALFLQLLQANLLSLLKQQTMKTIGKSQRLAITVWKVVASTQ